MKDFAIICHKVFSSPDGKELLEQLFEQFVNREIVTAEPSEMVKRAAEHDLIIYLMGMVKHGSN